MSNANRIAGGRKKAQREPRARKVKVDIDSLPDAVVDRKLIVPLKGRVVFERTLNKRTMVHEGTIFSVADDGHVTIWDETRGQFYSFNLNQGLPVIKSMCQTNELTNGTNVHEE